MKKIILLSISLFLIVSTSLAQYQTVNWYVGPNTFLDFKSFGSFNTPVPYPSPSGLNISGSTSILSDSLGNVVIYVENDTIFFPTTGNKINPIGGAIYAPNQGFIIQGEQINNIIYFEIFTLSSNSPIGYELRYTSGNINNGVLNFDNSNITVISGLSSKMAVYREAGKTFVIVHLLASNEYLIYDNLPDLTNKSDIIGSIYGSSIGDIYDNGFLKFSPSGEYLVSTSSNPNELSVFNFDKANSILTNERKLTDHPYNATEFAAGDNNILYAATDYDIFQMNISATDITFLPNPIGIASNPIMNMQLALDGKIYVSKSGESFLGAINNPEIQDDACFYDDQEVMLSMTSNGILPSFPSNYFKVLPIITWNPNFIIYDTPVNFNINFPISSDSVYFDFGNNDYINFTSNTFTHKVNKLGVTEFKVVLFFNENNIWDSLTMSKKALVKLPPGMHIIEPYDKIICDTFTGFNVHINYDYPDRKFIWTSLNGHLNTITTNTDTILKYPDEYYLEIQDNNHNTLARDTLVVKNYNPYEIIPSQSVFDNSSSIDYTVLDNQEPETFLTNADFNFYWNWGDGNENNSNSNTLNHRYNTVGDYTLNIEINTTGNCVYNLSKNIHIVANDTIFPNAEFLNIKDTTLCDSITNFITIEKRYTSYKYEINWYYEGTEITSNYNNRTLTTNKPGKYWVDLYDGNLHSSDTAIIHYKICQNIEVDLFVNGKNETYHACDGNSNLNFSVYINNLDFCPIDQTNFYYYWDFGDNILDEGFGLNEMSHIYTTPGIYTVQLFLIDEKGCEHSKRKTVYIQAQSADTIYYTANKKDLAGNYIIDLNSLNLFSEDFYNKSTFFQSVTNTQLSTGTSVFDLTINSDTTVILENESDISIFLNFAIWGDFTGTIITPSGKSVNLANINDPNNYPMFGYPGTDLNDYELSKTKTYFFNSNGIDIDEIAPGVFSQSYYTPMEQMHFGNFHFLDKEVLKFDDVAPLIGEKISGNWRFYFGNSTHYGKIKSWGIKFNPKIMQDKNYPSHVYCYDDEGNMYESTNLILKIEDLGGTNNVLHCEFEFTKTNCRINKTLIIEYPEIPNNFTPNGDGINDYWLPISPNSGAKVVVIDKVGRVVADFFSSDIEQGWDGTHNDNALPSDSYWYIITLKSGKILKGVLTIIR